MSPVLSLTLFVIRFYDSLMSNEIVCHMTSSFYHCAIDN